MTDSEFTAAVAKAIKAAPSAMQAAVDVYALCVAKAQAEGMKPEIEVAIHRPGQDRHHSDNNCWGVCFEAGPYEWAIDASIDIGQSRVLAEPYYGFDLSFYDV